MEEFIVKHTIAIAMVVVLALIVGICVMTSDANMDEERIEQIVEYDEYKTMALNQ